jgi:hypothetical protein
MAESGLVERTLREHLSSVMVRGEARGKGLPVIAKEVAALLVRLKALDTAEGEALVRQLRGQGSVEAMISALAEHPETGAALEMKIRIKPRPPLPAHGAPAGSLLDMLGHEIRRAIEEHNFAPSELRAKAAAEGVPVWRAARMLRKSISTADAAEIIVRGLAASLLKPPSPADAIDKAVRAHLGEKEVYPESIEAIQNLLWHVQKGALRKLLARPAAAHSLRVAAHRAVEGAIRDAGGEKVDVAMAAKRALETLQLARGKIVFRAESVLRIVQTRLKARQVWAGMANPFKSLDRFLDILSEQPVTWENPHTGRAENCSLRKVLAERVLLCEEDGTSDASTQKQMSRLVRDIDVEKAERQAAEAEPAIAKYLKGARDDDWRKAGDFNISKDELKEVADVLAVKLQKTREKIAREEDDKRQGKSLRYGDEVRDFKGVGVSVSEMVQAASAGRDLRQEIRQAVEDAAERSKAKDDQQMHTEAGIRIKRKARVYGGTPSEGWQGEDESSTRPPGRVVIDAVDPTEKEKLIQQALDAEEKKGGPSTPASPPGA